MTNKHINGSNIGRLRPATYRDVESILSIGDSHDLRKKKSSGELRKGFLVYLFDKTEIEEMLHTPQDFLRVYDTPAGVDGYIAAYDKNRWLLKDPRLGLTIPVTPDAQQILDDSYLYARHIAVRRHASSEVASTIETEFFREMKTQGYRRVIGEISLNPLNQRSLIYHLARNFSLIGVNYDTDKKITWGVVCKELK